MKRRNINYLPYDPELKEKARDLRKNCTAAESKLWREYLRNHKYKFTRQKPIDNFIVDFYCSELGLIIEVDGTTHLDNKDIIYDSQRTDILEKKHGLKIIRFWNNDIFNGIHIVSEMIENEIKKCNNPPLPSLVREGKKLWKNIIIKK